MSSRKRGTLQGLKPTSGKIAAPDPGFILPPVLPKTIDDKRTAALEAAARLARMTPDEHAAALFQSLGGKKS